VAIFPLAIARRFVTFVRRFIYEMYTIVHTNKQAQNVSRGTFCQFRVMFRVERFSIFVPGILSRFQGLKLMAEADG